jgi:hypothetical protein
MYLSKKIKESLKMDIGLSVEEMAKMSEDELVKYVEKKTGKKIEWSKDAKVDLLPIRPLKDNNYELDR